MAILNYLGEALLYAGKLLVIGLVPWLILGGVMQLCSQAIRRRMAQLFSMQGYIYLTAPGVAIHELSHAFFCLVFRHKITEMKLFSPEEDGTLGYVCHSYNSHNIYHRIGNFFIGTGPIWGGLLMIYLATKILLPEKFLQNSDFRNFLSAALWKDWETWVWLYLILTISSHITLSAPDLKGSGDGLIALIVWALIFSLVVLKTNFAQELLTSSKTFAWATLSFLSFPILLLVVLAVISWLTATKS